MFDHEYLELYGMLTLILSWVSIQMTCWYDVTYVLTMQNLIKYVTGFSMVRKVLFVWMYVRTNINMFLM